MNIHHPRLLVAALLLPRKRPDPHRALPPEAQAQAEAQARARAGAEAEAQCNHLLTPLS